MAGQALAVKKPAPGTEGDSSDAPYLFLDSTETTPTDPTKAAKYKASSEQAYHV